jgi:hypothetical protein
VNFPDGQAVQVAMVGRESIVGGAAGLDGGPLLAAAGVVAPDAATLPSVADFRAAFHRRGALRSLVARHQQAVLAQTPAIRRMQPVPLSRWPLRARDLCARPLAERGPAKSRNDAPDHDRDPDQGTDRVRRLANFSCKR